MNRLLKTIFSLLFLLSVAASFAQSSKNNPYSRYGIGEFLPQQFAHQLGMGGLSAATHDQFQLNPINPAASSFLSSTAFEVGLFSKRSTYMSNSSELTQWSGNLAYMNLGMTLKSPINKALDKTQSPWNYGLSIGLTPFSDVGYNVTTVDTLPDLGRVIQNFGGSGGTYKFRWGASARYNQTAVGLNLGWLFGTNRYENTTYFTDSVSTFQNNFRDDIATSGLTWNLGLMHDFVLAREIEDSDTPTRWLTVGLHGNGKQKLKTKSDQLRLRSRGQLSNGSFASADTVLFVESAKNDLTLPAEFAIGLSYVRDNKYKFGGEIGFATWSDYKNDARPATATFQDAFSVAVGAEITPDYLSYNNYGKRIRYRFGGYYRKDPRVVNNESVTDKGLTFGFGFPAINLKERKTAFVNTAFEIGKLGDGTPISETYFRVTVGFTMNDNSWFYKRRFE